MLILSGRVHTESTRNDPRLQRADLEPCYSRNHSQVMDPLWAAFGQAEDECRRRTNRWSNASHSAQFSSGYGWPPA